MAKSPGPSLPPIQSRQEAESILGLYASQVLTMQSTAKELEEKIAGLRREYEPKISALNESAILKGKRLQDWAQASPADFGEKKSMDLIHGTIGFRLGNRQLKTRSKFTWAKVLTAVQEKFSEYVRNKPEVNKELILNDCAESSGRLKAEDLSAMGVRVVQEESFYIDLKKL